MKNMKKKGFTLVELLVVIAIIAILAAVSVVGYTVFIKKANMSADQQAVTQMNTMLEALDVNDEPKDIVALWTYLNQTGLTAEDYRPLSKGHSFVWDKTLNRILLIDENNKVVYPEDYVNATEANGWFNLANTIETGEAPKIENGAVSIGNASDLITSIENVADINTMNLNGNVNLMGASTFIPKVNNNLTISGSNATISNLVSSEYATVGTGDSAQNQQYASGFVGTVQAGKKLVIKDVVIDGATIGDYETGSVGVIVGSLFGELVLENVTIKNCTVYGQNKVGIIAGQVGATAKITMKNVKIENCTVKSSESEAAQLFGVVFTNAKVDIDSNCSVTNTKVSIDAYGNHSNVTIGGKKYVTKVDGNGAVDTKKIGDNTYTRVCECPSDNTLAWIYPEDHNDVVLNNSYCGRPAVAKTAIADIDNVD